MAPCLRLRRDGEEPLPNHKESGFLSQPHWKDIHVPFDIHVALTQNIVWKENLNIFNWFKFHPGRSPFPQLAKSTCSSEKSPSKLKKLPKTQDTNPSHSRRHKTQDTDRPHSSLTCYNERSQSESMCTSSQPNTQVLSYHLYSLHLNTYRTRATTPASPTPKSILKSNGARQLDSATVSRKQQLTKAKTEPKKVKVNQVNSAIDDQTKAKQIVATLLCCKF